MTKRKQRSLLWIMDENGHPIPEPDTIAWGKWWEQPGNRIIATDTIGDVRISTVFLGLDGGHSMIFGGAPQFFETMIFGGKHDQYQDRYTTKYQALKGHAKAVKLVQEDK